MTQSAKEEELSSFLHDLPRVEDDDVDVSVQFRQASEVSDWGTARDKIQHCLTLWGDKPLRIRYDGQIMHGVRRPFEMIQALHRGGEPALSLTLIDMMVGTERLRRFMTLDPRHITCVEASVSLGQKPTGDFQVLFIAVEIDSDACDPHREPDEAFDSDQIPVTIRFTVVEIPPSVLKVDGGGNSDGSSASGSVSRTQEDDLGTALQSLMLETTVGA